MAICAAAISGCAYLRVPKIDPTGRRIFATPPVSAAPQFESQPAAQTPFDDVAVMLSPRVTVAPVGSEVVLTAGVRAADGYLRTNRRLEWSLARGGAGHFVAVGKAGVVDLLLGDFNRPRKVDNTFAVGSTSRKYVRLTRGTPAATDDVCVLRGQGWITLTSAAEGTSHVTVYAPGVYAWDCRMRSATIHWVDAQWSYPSPAINPAGTTHTFTTTLTRQSDNSPCPGWIVRYEIVDGPAAGFSPDGAQVVEVATDASGQASVEIFQKEPGPGTNKIGIQIIRPAAVGGSTGRRLVIDGGSTLKTWTAPQVAVRKTGPATALVGATLSYQVEVTNPGDMPAEDVTVTDEVPDGLTYLDSNPAAEVTGKQLRWRLGQLGAGQRRVLELNFRAARPGSVANCANVTAAGGLKASDCATTTVVTATLDLKMTGPEKTTVGDEVTFEIVLANRAQAPTGKLLIKDSFDTGLKHAEASSPIVRDLGILGPGESKTIHVTFTATKAGRLCHTVEVTGGEGLRAVARACVRGVEKPAGPILPQPAAGTISIKKTGPQSSTVGETAKFLIDITNTSQQTLTDLRVVDRLDAGLVPVQASEGSTYVGNDLVWTIGSLPAGKTHQLEIHCRCEKAAAKACNRTTVTTRQGARAEAEACLKISAAAEVAAPSGLSISVADLLDPVKLGKELTYEIRLRNRGQAADTQATVVVTVPAGMMPVPLGTTGPVEPSIEGRTIRFKPVAEVPPGKTLTYRIRVLTQQPGQHTLHVELTSQNLTPAVTIEETTEVFQ